MNCSENDAEGAGDNQMFTRFKDYCENVLPRLEDAFRKELSSLFKGMGSHYGTSLSAGLQGGKMIRGCLVCLISEGLEGSFRSAIPRAVAVELIHGASLIHDDFVDQDEMRRNKPAIWTLEGARRAVLLGDVIFASTIKTMNELSRDDGLVVSHAIAQIAKGAFQEPLEPLHLAMAIQSDKVNARLYEKIISLKTGLLFGSACQMGAIAAGGDDEVRKTCYRYGSLIGEAYQIADDLKEVRHHLSRRAIHPKEMAFLTPAFLYFVKSARPHLLTALKSENAALDGPLLPIFQDALPRMEEEIERRLQSAVAEVELLFPENGFGELAHRAPWEIIEMFNAI
jgi:hypothetical protein